MTKQDIPVNPLVIWIRFVLRMVLYAVALMWPAGTWTWWEAWVLLGLWTIYGVVFTPYLLKHDPALLTERLKLVPLHKEQKQWDKVIMILFFAAAIALLIVPGLEVVRYNWSEPLPLWLKVIGFAIQIPCFFGLGWVMRENTFLAQVVKIDKQRNHHVITTGPYTWVRHPMYTIASVLFFAIPVALGSRYALLLAALLTLLLIIRTYLEDRTLHKELDGYAQYAKQTPYRLIPGIW